MVCSVVNIDTHIHTVLYRKICNWFFPPLEEGSDTSVALADIYGSNNPHGYVKLVT